MPLKNVFCILNCCWKMKILFLSYWRIWAVPRKERGKSPLPFLSFCSLLYLHIFSPLVPLRTLQKSGSAAVEYTDFFMIRIWTSWRLAFAFLYLIYILANFYHSLYYCTYVLFHQLFHTITFKISERPFTQWMSVLKTKSSSDLYWSIRVLWK